MSAFYADYHVSVSGPSGSPAILFLHGFMGSGADWRPMCDYLAAEYRCLTVDLPGHGRTLLSAAPDPYSMPRVAQNIAGMLDELAIERLNLVGYSMGGRLALYLALAFPQRFERLVLESASPGLADAAERAERIKRDEVLAQRLESENFGEFLEYWYALPLFASLRRSAAFPALLERRKNNVPAALALSLRAMGAGSQPPLWDRLTDLAMPVLALAGALDTKFCVIADAMAQKSARVQAEKISGAGHNIHAEKTSDFCKRLQQFFER